MNIVSSSRLPAFAVNLLLSDTKLTKYIIQLVIIRHRPRDLAQKMQTTADIQRQQVAGVQIVHALVDIVQVDHYHVHANGAVCIAGPGHQAMALQKILNVDFTGIRSFSNGTIF